MAKNVEKEIYNNFEDLELLWPLYPFPQMLLRLILSLLTIFLIQIMVKNKPSCFGAPDDFSESKLPTYKEVGRQFLKSRIDLEAEAQKKEIEENHEKTGKVSNRQVASRVNQWNILIYTWLI